MKKVKNLSVRLTERKPIIRLVTYAIVIACMLPFFACDKITKTDVKVSKATIELEDIVVQEGTPSKGQLDDELNYFSASQTIYLNQIEGFTEEVLKHQSKIDDITVGTATITITAIEDETGTVVKDFLLQATGVSPNISIPQYDLGTAYTGNVQPFATALLLKLFQASSVTVNVSGKTDITSGKNLKVKIEMGDMVFVVKLINL